MGVKVEGVPALPDDQYKRRPATRYRVVHCAQTPSTWDKGIEKVRQWHVEERGWKDVGYHYFIRRDGTIQRGRPRWAIGSGVAGRNFETIHICLAGGCDAAGREENNFTPAQFESLEHLLVELGSIYPGSEVCGHRDFPGVDKFCPAFDVKEWWNGDG